MEDLFVCYAGVIRSKIGRDIARRIAQEKGLKDYIAHNISIRELCNFIQGGLKHDRYSRIFVMEESFKKLLIGYGVSQEKVINLNVTGELERTRESVTQELEQKLTPYFQDIS